MVLLDLYLMRMLGCWVLVDKRACVVVGFDVVCTVSRTKRSYCCVSEVFVLYVF